MNKRTIITDNTEPPKNYLWHKLSPAGLDLGVYEYRDGKWNKIETEGGGGAENNDRTITLNDVKYIKYTCNGFSESLGNYYDINETETSVNGFSKLLGFDESIGILYITESTINEIKNKIPEDGNVKELSIQLMLKTNTIFEFRTSDIKNMNMYNPSDGKAVLSLPVSLGNYSLTDLKADAKAGATQIALLVK